MNLMLMRALQMGFPIRLLMLLLLVAVAAPAIARDNDRDRGSQNDRDRDRDRDDDDDDDDDEEDRPIDPRIDIRDLYVFQSPSNTSNTVLIMTLGTDPQFPSAFSREAEYEFKIDKNNNNKEDVSYRIKTKKGKRGRTYVELKQTPAPKRGGSKLAEGRIGQVLPVRTGGLFMAGYFDDPAFQDGVAIEAFRATGDPSVFCNPGLNSNATSNSLALILEVPTRNLGNRISVWAVSKGNDDGKDRQGAPLITTLVLPEDLVEDFVDNKPRKDRREFGEDVVQSLIDFGNDPVTAEQTAQLILPDVLRYDASLALGYPNGRQLDNDAVDLQLGLITNGVVLGDCVANDSLFGLTFPYLAPANPILP